MILFFLRHLLLKILCSYPIWEHFESSNKFRVFENSEIIFKNILQSKKPNKG